MTSSTDVRHLFSGALAGLLSCIIVHPLDVIRTRMQVFKGPGVAYLGTFEAFRTILRTEGVSSLYRGLFPAILGSGLSWGLFMWFYNLAKDKNSFFFSHPTLNHLLSASEAGIFTSLLTNPIWLCKTRLEVQRSAAKIGQIPYKGMFDCMRRMLREEGFLSFYRGIVPSILLSSHGAIQFAVYESLKANPHISSYLFVNASIAKIIATCVTFPLTTIRARLHLRPEAGFNYTSVKQTFFLILREEGIRGFFKGLTPCLLRVTPHSALMIVLYEFLFEISAPIKQNSICIRKLWNCSFRYGSESNGFM